MISLEITSGGDGGCRVPPRRPGSRRPVSLTKGSGPFGSAPAGSFNFDPRAPEHVLYVEPSPRRVRVTLGGTTVADSTDVRLLHPPGRTPTYLFPRDHVRMELFEPSDRRRSDPATGEGTYWTVRVGDRRAADAAYPSPGTPATTGSPWPSWNANWSAASAPTGPASPARRCSARRACSPPPAGRRGLGAGSGGLRPRCGASCAAQAHGGRGEGSLVVLCRLFITSGTPLRRSFAYQLSE